MPISTCSLFFTFLSISRTSVGAWTVASAGSMPTFGIISRTQRFKSISHGPMANDYWLCVGLQCAANIPILIFDCSIAPWAMESEMASRWQMVTTWPTCKGFAWGYAGQILELRFKSSSKTEVTIIGFGSLLSKKSALLTTPSMKVRELPRVVSREYSSLTARASSMSKWRATNGNLHILLQSSSSDSWLQKPEDILMIVQQWGPIWRALIDDSRRSS